MRRFARGLFVSAMVLTCALAPLSAEWCTVMCGAASAAGHPAAATPLCHHHGTAAIRLKSTPPPCGHNHQAVSLQAAAAASDAPRWTTTMLAGPARPAVPEPSAAALEIRAGPMTPQRPGPLSLTLSAALRI